MPHVQAPRTPDEKEAFLALRRFETYFRDCIEPAVFPGAEPAAVRISQLTDPAKPAPVPGLTGESGGPAFDPSKLLFFPAAMPCAWGPKWSTAWFHVRGAVPERFAGKTVVLRFSSGTEAQVWRQTGAAWAPAQGLDVNREVYRPFPAAARAGETFELFIEAACNHPFGVTGFEWDHPEVHARWSSATPGRLDRCELAVLDEAAWELRQQYALAVQLAGELPLDSPRFADLIAHLRAATIAFPDVEKASAALRPALTRPAPASATRCLAVGHAHLDTAWLWPIRETKRKVLRTFSNQLRNMERFPTYNFLASQAQHYAWVEERSPELFEQIKQRVAEGRWEPAGAMWVEPDINCISGESIIRQILHGVRYWESRFGDRGRQRLLYLPDTFGFGSNLPQIMKLAGLDTFITNKLHWWQHTTFPHTTFLWRGIDGSTVLAHNTPGQDYNATNTPKELRKGESTLLSLLPLPEGRGRAVGSPAPPPSASELPTSVGASSNSPLWFQPFGFGDGGGGATDWSIRFAQLAADCAGLPRMELSTANAFCDALHDQLRRGTPFPTPFPTWEGELDMEIHRGTFTSQAWIKRANREAEEKLRLAEILLALHEPDAQAWGDAEALDRAWKLTLLNQFHDILPGSSIGQVYDDARRDYIKVDTIVRPIIDRELDTLHARAPGPTALNPTSSPFTGVVVRQGEPWFAANVPALGCGPMQRSLPDHVQPVTVAQHGPRISVSNGLVEMRLDEFAHIESLRGLGGAELAPPHNCLNILATYEDRPMMWDAWDIDEHYEDKGVYYSARDAARIVESSPLRVVLEVRDTLGRTAGSTIVERYTITAGSPRIDIHHQVEWRERHTLLRLFLAARLPLDSTCTHGIHFGHQTRPTHRNTVFQRARFEFPVQGWMDVSSPGAGLAVLSDSKFGFSCRQGNHTMLLGVSLLRSPTWPDPEADQGSHEYTVSLIPHAGDWKAAGVDRHAESLRRTPFGLAECPGAPLSPHIPNPPFTIQTSGQAAVSIPAFKRDESGAALILRLHESHGATGPCSIRWNFPTARVEPVNLLERPMPLAGFHHDAATNTTTLDLTPFQIVTLAITRA